MSTYLVAYVISKFETMQVISDSNVIVQVAARPQAIQDGDGDFALEETLKILEYYENLFGIKHSMPISSWFLILNKYTHYFILKLFH
jgi:aminopeptidase N